MAEFKAVESDRVGLVQADDFAEVGPVEPVIGGRGQPESRVQRVVGELSVIGHEQATWAEAGKACP